MNIEPPFGLDPAEVEQILKDAAGEPDLGKRIDRISGLFLSRPYIEGSLGGGAELAEELRISLSAFDCVTFIECVLALALTRTIDEFIDTIRRIRYKDRSEEHTSELQSHSDLVCRLLLEKKKKKKENNYIR